jgi:hypothetical protein
MKACRRVRKEKANELVAAVAGIDRNALRGSLAKEKFVQFRATREEKESLKATAAKMNLSVSEYLLRIHSLVAEKLGGKAK